MNCLLTGFSGFLGKSLGPYLLNRVANVKQLSLRGDWLQSIPSEYNAIIHLAGKAHDTKNTSAADEYFKVNTDLTKQLFDLFLKSNARSFIYVSSVKAAVDSVKGVLSEETPADPQTPYGQSKLKAEEYILSKPLSDDRRVYILRPCMIHGPGNKGNLNLIYQVGKRGIPYPLAAFHNQRSFVSVENMCFVISEFLSNDFPSGVYNVADNEPLSTNEIMGMIYAEHGFKNRLVSLPKSIVKFGARMGDLFKLPLNTERLQKMTEDYVVSNRKLIDTLGKPLPIAAREGMRLTIKSFKEET